MTELKRFTRSPFSTLGDFSEHFSKLKNIDDKEEINQRQIEDKAETNRRQSGDKLETNRRQIEDNPSPNLQETGDKLETISKTNRRQIGDKPRTKGSFSNLVGLQRSLIIFIYNECKIARSKTTKSLSIEYISSALNSPFSSIKKTLQRLEEKQFINRDEFKIGRGGWSKYSLSDHAFQEVLQYESEDKVRTNWRQTEDKLESQPRTSTPVVSSSYINTTTNKSNNLEGIDFSALEEIGFSQSHLLQISRAYQEKPEITLSETAIQDSLDAFAFDIKYNKDRMRLRNEPITVLISLLRQGKPYTCITPGKFKTPRQEALDSYLSIQKQKHEIEIEAIEKLKKIEYDKWLSTLPEEDLLGMCADTEFPGVPSGVIKSLKKKKAMERSIHYFDAEIWPGLKREIEKNISK